GVPLVRALIAEGHDVTAMTRTPAKQGMLRALGAAPVVADALSAEEVMRAVTAARPAHLIHQLTALPKTGPKRVADLTETNRLRDEGRRYLLNAAIAARAKRFIGGSFALVGKSGESVPETFREATSAVQSMEFQIVEASRRGFIEGVVLRYGGFYGPGNPMT